MSEEFERLSLSSLRGRRSEKWRAYAEDALPLWVAEMDFPLAAPVARALHELVDESDTGYASRGRLPEAYADFARRRYGDAPDPDHMVPFPDVMRGVLAAIELFTQPGDGVVVNTPVYPPFFSTIRYAGRRVVEAPLRQRIAGARFELDLEAVERAFERDGAAAYLLCNPHNPTGRVLAREELLAISAIVERHAARVLADEVHAPLTYPGMRHVPFSSLGTEAAARSVSFVSASKAWNLPGAKCALAIGGDEETARALAELPPEVKEPGIFGAVAGEVAFREGGAWLEDALAHLDGNRSALGTALAERLPGVAWCPPEATYLAWLDCRALGLGPDPSVAFLERGVALNAGPAFGAPGEGFVRLNFATSRAILLDAVERMASGVDGG